MGDKMFIFKLIWYLLMIISCISFVYGCYLHHDLIAISLSIFTIALIVFILIIEMLTNSRVKIDNR